MPDAKMMAQMAGRDGFIAALDQSGGSTPGALRLYGIPDNAYSNDAEMFTLVHQMRVRIMTASAFTGAKVIGAILFEGTMDGEVRGKPTPAFLWEERGVVPFVTSPSASMPITLALVGEPPVLTTLLRRTTLATPSAAMPSARF